MNHCRFPNARSGKLCCVHGFTCWSAFRPNARSNASQHEAIPFAIDSFHRGLRRSRAAAPSSSDTLPTCQGQQRISQKQLFEKRAYCFEYEFARQGLISWRAATMQPRETMRDSECVEILIKQLKYGSHNCGSDNTRPLNNRPDFRNSKISNFGKLPFVFGPEVEDLDEEGGLPAGYSRTKSAPICERPRQRHASC